MTERDQNLKLYKIYLLFTLIASIVCAVVRTIALAKYYEEGAHSYMQDTPSFISALTPALIILFCAVIASFFFLIPKGSVKRLPYDNTTLLSKCASALPALALLILTALLLLLSAGSDSSISLNSAFKGGLSLFGASHLLSVIGAVFTAAYFMLDVLEKKRSALLSLSMFVFSAFYALRVYFDMSTLLSSPIRLMTILSACALILFSVLETRTVTGKSASRLYIAGAMVTVLVTFTSAIPSLVLTLTGTLSDTLQCLFSFAELAVGIYAFARLFSFSLGGTCAFDEDEITPPEEVTEDAVEEEDEEDEENKTEEHSGEYTLPEGIVINGSDDIDGKELAEMYHLVRKTVLSRIKDVDLSPDEAEEQAKLTSVSVLESVFKNDAQRDERITRIREMIAASRTESEEEKKQTDCSEPTSKEQCEDEVKGGDDLQKSEAAAQDNSSESRAPTDGSDEESAGDRYDPSADESCKPDASDADKTSDNE